MIFLKHVRVVWVERENRLAIVLNRGLDEGSRNTKKDESEFKAKQYSGKILLFSAWPFWEIYFKVYLLLRNSLLLGQSCGSDVKT